MAEPIPIASLRRQLFAAVTTSAGVRLVTAVLAIATTRKQLEGLGVETFGVYSAIVGLTAFSAFLDAGIGSGVRTNVAESGSNAGESQRWTRAGMLMIGSIALVLLTLFLVSLGFVPWPLLLGVEGVVQSQEVRISLAAFAVPYFLGLPLLSYQRAVEGLGRSHLVALSAIFPSLTLFIGAQFLTLSNGGVVAFAALAGLSTLPGALFVAGVFRRIFSRMRYSVSSSLSDCRHLWAGSWPMIIVSIALSLSYGLDPVLIAYFLGPTDVATYALSSKLVQLGIVLIVSSAPVLWSHFARERASNLGISRNESLSRLMVIYGALGLALAACLVVFGPFATELWSGGEVVAPRDLFVAFGAWTAVLAVQLPPAMRLTSAAALRFQAKTTSFMAAMNIPLSVLLVQLVGISGPVWSSAFCLALFHAIPISIRSVRTNREVAARD